MAHYSPPFEITPSILKKCQQIAYELGIVEGAKIMEVPPTLRRANKIRTIQSTLAIEGNRLSIEQVTDIVDGKTIIGPDKDILEANNAIKLYSKLTRFDPLSLDAFKLAHEILMENLIPDNGNWRTKGVGVFKGSTLAHMAPPASRVPGLMNSLFEFLNSKEEIAWLIKASVFHYELEFIHPFSDGNGRMGRLWQQLIFMKEDPIFQYLPVESMIKKNQKQYYQVLAECDKVGNSTAFIEFSLAQVLLTLKEYAESSITKIMDAASRLKYAKEKLKNEWFSRKDYLMIHKNISTATASRDLEKGLQLKMLIRKGDKKLTQYRFTRMDIA